MHPVAIVIPIFGDARLGTATGAGQYGQPRVLAKKSDQALGLTCPSCSGVVRQSKKSLYIRSLSLHCDIQLVFRLDRDNGITATFCLGHLMIALKKWYFGIAVCSVAFLLETFLPIALF
jgi:hypothetical protein